MNNLLPMCLKYYCPHLALNWNLCHSNGKAMAFYQQSGGGTQHRNKMIVLIEIDRFVVPQAENGILWPKTG